MHATSNAHIDKGSKPCLCRNCVYKSKPESQRDELLHGSRIDKLYYDQYLPLREKKLLEKLVRTRAIYDDIRTRILESDTDNDENCGCVNRRKVTNDTESKPIHDIVSLVDRGELSSLNSSFNLHSECCTCCDCKPKVTNQPKVHIHIPSLEVVEEYLSKHKEKKFKSESYLSALKLSSEKNRLKYERKHLKPILETEKARKESLKKDNKEHKKSLKPIVCKCFEKHQVKGSIVSIQHAVNEIKESVLSSISIMGNKFQNLKKDSLVLFREKKKHRKNYDIMEDWACAPNFCIPDNCDATECYKEMKRRLPDLDHTRKIRFADEKIQTYKSEIKTSKVKKAAPKRKRKSKIQQLICECKHRNVIKSAASMTNVSLAKTTSTNKTSTRTKSASSTGKQRPHRRKRRNAPTSKHLPFPRECDPGMCEPDKCSPEDCAKILLKISQGAHYLDSEYKSTQQQKKSQTKEHKIKKQKITQKPKVEKIICECNNMKSTTSTTTLSAAKTTTTHKSSVATKSTLSVKKRKQRKGHVAISKPLPFPRECDPGMCEPDKCNLDDCAKILLRNSQAAHNLDRCYCTLKLKKHPKKAIAKLSETSSTEIKQKKQQAKKNIKETATQPKKIEKVTRKTRPPASKVKSVQKDIERCFCTLDLNKTLGKESIMPKADESKNTSSTTSQTQVRKVKKSVPKKQKQKQPPKIDKPIHENTSSTSTESHDQKPVAKKTKITSASVPKTTRRNVQTRVPKHRKPIKPTENPDMKDYSTKSKSSPDAPARQVVRISSSFRFDIEFFKNKNYPDTKKITNNSSTVTSKTSETEGRTNKLKQSKIPRKKTKASKPKVERNEPLKRCFCTLELHKNSKKNIKNKKPPVSKEKKKSGTKKVIKYETVATRKSHECELDFCTVGQCDPYECEKRIKMRSSTETNTDPIRSNTNSSSTPNSSSKAISSKLGDSKSKPTTAKANILTKCFCTKNLYKKQKNKVKNTQTKIEKRNQTKHKSLVTKIKCMCTLKLHIKPKKEKKKDIPVKARTTETQTDKVKHRKYKARPTKPKRKSTYSYPSGFSETLDSSTEIQPRKTKKRDEKIGFKDKDSGDSLPSSSPNKTRQAVRIGSQISFSIEFYKNKKQAKKNNKNRNISASTNYGGRSRGDSTNVRYFQEIRGNPVKPGVKLKMMGREKI